MNKFGLALLSTLTVGLWNIPAGDTKPYIPPEILPQCDTTSHTYNIFIRPVEGERLFWSNYKYANDVLRVVNDEYPDAHKCIIDSEVIYPERTDISEQYVVVKLIGHNSHSMNAYHLLNAHRLVKYSTIIFVNNTNR